MIFLNKDILNESVETINLIEIEKAFLNSNIMLYKKKKEKIINYMQDFADCLDGSSIDSTSSIQKNTEDLKKSLKLCNLSIENYNCCIENIDSIITSIKNHDSNIEELVKDFNLNYAKLNKNIIKNAIEIENCLTSISEKAVVSLSAPKTAFGNTSLIRFLESEETISNTSENTSDTANDTTSEQKSNDNIINTNFDHIEFPDDIKEIEFNIKPTYNHVENTLVVSDKSGTVTLPYYISNLEDIMNHSKGKYKSIDEVIYNKYTLPLSMFKNPFTSRFKEAFFLIRHKEHGSILDAFELGLELMFNNNLHPAIISACNNLDELDIYLDYLKSGKTNRFKCFKIIFDLAPVASPKRKTNY